MVDSRPARGGELVGQHLGIRQQGREWRSQVKQVGGLERVGNFAKWGNGP